MTTGSVPAGISAVYDTNVLISGLFWRGKPRQVIHLARTGQVDAVTCQELLDELRDVLTRPDKPFRLSASEAAGVIEDVLSYARVVTPISGIDACRDPKDNIVLACAVGGNAQYVITGDPDLLVLKEYQGVKIVKVADFAALSF